MFYTNARIFVDNEFRMGAFEVVDGKFGAILPENVPADAIDLGGATVIPGLIEVHSHGCAGADFSDGDYEGLKAMAKQYAAWGVTSFAPASMTLPYDVLEKAFATAKRLVEENIEGLSVLRGIQMEGPFFCYAKRGAQNADYLKNPDFEGFKALYDGCDGLVRIVDVAPELPGAAEFVAQASKLCTVSIAHTDSDYDHAKAAVDAGVTPLPHLYNAMPAIHHRNPVSSPPPLRTPRFRPRSSPTATTSIPPPSVWPSPCSRTAWFWSPTPAAAPARTRATSSIWAARWLRSAAVWPSWWAPRPSPAPLPICGPA